MPDKYLAYKGLAPKRIPHWEMWSCPDAETLFTGIDYYRHPRLCRLRMAALYPDLELPIPAEDAPKDRPDFATKTGEDGHTYSRWGDATTDLFAWGDGFRTAEDVFSFSPLEKGDFRDLPVGERWDYRDEESLYREFRKKIPLEWGDRAPDGSSAWVSFYNTMFMWPLLTFGWDLFLETCLDARFTRIMDEFAELNRRVFRVFARLPVHFVVCHDDIVTAQGPVCSPAWMNRYIFPRYEEFWSILRAAGKEVIFMADGCMNRYADDVFACGASGIYTEPYTDFKAIAKRHENCFLCGEGDNRILKRNRPEEIRAMVDAMVETAKITGGYVMGIGNHITWDLPPEAVRVYLDYSAEVAHR